MSDHRLRTLERAVARGEVGAPEALTAERRRLDEARGVVVELPSAPRVGDGDAPWVGRPLAEELLNMDTWSEAGKRLFHNAHVCGSCLRSRACPPGARRA